MDIKPLSRSTGSADSKRLGMTVPPIDSVSDTYGALEMMSASVDTSVAIIPPSWSAFTVQLPRKTGHKGGFEPGGPSG